MSGWEGRGELARRRRRDRCTARRKETTSRVIANPTRAREGTDGGGGAPRRTETDARADRDERKARTSLTSSTFARLPFFLARRRPPPPPRVVFASEATSFEDDAAFFFASAAARFLGAGSGVNATFATRLRFPKPCPLPREAILGGVFRPSGIATEGDAARSRLSRKPSRDLESQTRHRR